MSDPQSLPLLNNTERKQAYEERLMREIACARMGINPRTGELLARRMPIREIQQTFDLSEWELRVILYGNPDRDEEHPHNVSHRRYAEIHRELAQAFSGENIQRAIGTIGAFLPEAVDLFIDKFRALAKESGARGSMSVNNMMNTMLRLVAQYEAPPDEATRDALLAYQRALERQVPDVTAIVKVVANPPTAAPTPIEGQARQVARPSGATPTDSDTD